MPAELVLLLRAFGERERTLGVSQFHSIALLPLLLSLLNASPDTVSGMPLLPLLPALLIDWLLWLPLCVGPTRIDGCSDDAPLQVLLPCLAAADRSTSGVSSSGCRTTCVWGDCCSKWPCLCSHPGAGEGMWPYNQ